MNYYEQLYDINFFSRDSYKAKVNNSSVIIHNSGIPDWETWQSLTFDSEQAKQVWDNFNDKKQDYYTSALFTNNIPKDDYLLLTLILCEDAYRNYNYNVFFLLNRILYKSEIPHLRLKAIKLHYAWIALSYLSKNNKKPLTCITKHCLTYLKQNLHLTHNYTIKDIKVEIPVRNAWEKLKISYNDRESIEDFYKNTYSYILELTAANHQVETLFNYSVVLNLIKRLGITQIFDYGGGIGTFLLLAHYYGIKGIFAELSSKTMDYALERFRFSGINIPVIKLNSKEYKLPKNLDCVNCTEVLEHIFYPELLIEAIYNSLRPKCLLIVSESFDYIEEFCTHLPQHKGKGGRKFLEYLNNIGLKQISVGYHIHPTINIKT